MGLEHYGHTEGLFQQNEEEQVRVLALYHHRRYEAHQRRVQQDKRLVEGINAVIEGINILIKSRGR